MCYERRDDRPLARLVDDEPKPEVVVPEVVAPVSAVAEVPEPVWSGDVVEVEREPEKVSA